MIKRLLGDSFIYGVTSYLSILAAILLTPVYSRIFTKAEYGILDIFNTWNSFVIAILPLGLISSVLRFYPDISKNFETKKNTLGTILSALTLLSAVYIIVMLLVKNFFLSYVGVKQVDEVYFHSIYIVIASLFFSYSKVILQSKFQKYYYVILSVVNFLILSILGFVFVYYYGMRILGFFRASSISLTITLLLGYFFIKDDVFFTFDKSTLNRILSYSIHFLSVFFLFKVVTIVDRIILLKFGSLSDVGIYNIGIKISGITKILFSAFSTAWFPISMSIKDKPNAKDIYRKIHDVFFIISFFLLFFLFLFRRELIYLFAPTYEASYNLIGILALSYLVNASVYLYSLGIHITKKTKYFTFAAVVSILVDISSSIILRKAIGIDGVAWGTLLGSLIWVIVQLILINKFYKVNFNYFLSICIIVFLIVLMYLIKILDGIFSNNEISVVIIKLSVFIFISLIMYFYYVKKLKYNLCDEGVNEVRKL